MGQRWEALLGKTHKLCLWRVYCMYVHRRALSLTIRQHAWCVQMQRLWLMQLFVGKGERAWESGTEGGQKDHNHHKRERQKTREKTGKREKAWGASMSLQIRWTHVRDPLLPSVWWSVAGAMSSQPGKSLHGSQHKSPYCSKLRYFAMFPPLPHVSKQLTILCPCLHGVTLDISPWDCGHVYKHGEMSLLGEGPPFSLIPRAHHVWELWFCQICLNMKHYELGSKVMSVQEALYALSMYCNIKIRRFQCYKKSAILYPP